MGTERVTLHVEEAGPPDGPLVVLLHGFPEFWQAWHRQLEEFGRDCRAVALDLRGYNLSAKPRGARHYALPAIVADVRAVLRALSPQTPAVLVGHDWGGLAAWTLARESPELLERLVIINAPHPPLFQRELKHSGAQRLASSYAAFFQLRGVAELALRAFGYAALRKMIFGLTRKPEQFPPALRDAYRVAWSQPYALTAGLSYYRNPRALKRLVESPASWRIEVPTLVLWGDRDRALLQGNLVGLEELVPRLTVQHHARATHWIVHEEPAWVNNSIRSFLCGG